MSSQSDPETPVVLVVDDQEDMADMYASFLEPEYRVLTAYSGEQALEMMDERVDVVFLDRRMPGLSGDEVLTTLREGKTSARIVLLTAVRPTPDIITLPFDDYLEKPVSKEILVDAVERMCKRNEFDLKIQQFMAIASKMATLESTLSLPEMRASSTYTELESELSALLAEGIDMHSPDEDLYAELSSEKIRAYFV